MDVEDALLWLARSGGTLTFSSRGMAGAAPSHANAGYAIEAAVPGPAGGRQAASAFAGSREARQDGVSPAVIRAISELMAKSGAPPQAAVLLPIRSAAPARPCPAAA